MPDTLTVFLVDNGSLQPSATQNLRALAAALSARAGRDVWPVSLLHSSAVDPACLGGVPAEILESALRRRYEAGAHSFALVPLFFGPSAALTAYIPERVEALKESLPGLRVRVAAPLVDPSVPDDARVARLLADLVRQRARSLSLARPAVVMVDHGSPQPAVGALRDTIARQLEQELGDSCAGVTAASMERRDGPRYGFNEPLLERALAGMSGDVVVSLLFFSPGRHAGPGGDIEQICRAAEASKPGLRVHTTSLVGEHPGVLDILEERLRSVIES